MKKLKECNIIAVDLDGTLADSSVIDVRDYHPEVIGPPIIVMVDRVKKWIELGSEIVIFTARVHPRHGKEEVELSERAIKKWCREVFGMEFEVTCMKDPMFVEYWDDRAVRVLANEGIISSQVSVNDPLYVGDMFSMDF